MPEVGVVQRGVMPALCEQALVIPLLDDPALFHHDDAVRGFDRGETVRDQDAGRIFQDQVQRLLDLPLGERVDAGGGFIQDEDGRLLHQDAHQRHQLALPHREPSAALPDLGLQPVRQRFQPFTVADLARHAQHLGIGHVRRSITDVICHRAREQERHLRNDPQLTAVLLQVKRADVLVIDQQTSLLKFVEAGDQLRNG